MKVAGVTFNNEPEDGARSRQQILYELWMSGRSIFTAELLYTTYNGKFAIKVREHMTKQVIGWIPKSDLASIYENNIRQMTGFIENVTGGVFSVRLLPQDPPTENQYKTMLEICRQYGYEMPPYDKRAYANVFSFVALHERKKQK